MTADLLAVLREAREALRSCAWSTELRTDDALMAMATADAKIGEATMMLTVSALRAHEAQGWRPIESAPKDGTPLRLFAESLIDEDFNPSGSAEGHWCDDVGWQAALWNDSAEEFYTAVIYPTHWQPLPPPPETTT